MPDPTLAPEYWASLTLDACAAALERLAPTLGVDYYHGVKLAIGHLRDNRLSIIASVTEPGGE